MKYPTYREYNPTGVATAESAFITVWAGLGSWHCSQASAPVRAASFVLGQATPGEPNDLRLHRLQIQQDMVDAGRLLQKTLTA